MNKRQLCADSDLCKVERTAPYRTSITTSLASVRFPIADIQLGSRTRVNSTPQCPELTAKVGDGDQRTTS